MAIKSLNDYIRDNEINMNQKFTGKQIQDITWTKKQKQNLTRYQPKKKEKKGNVVTRTLATIDDAFVNMSKGFLKTTEGVADTFSYLLADVTDFFGADEYADELRKQTSRNLIDELYGNSKTVKAIKNEAYQNKYVTSVEEGIGNVAAMAGGAKALGWANMGGTTSTLTTSFTSAYGNATSEALRNGADMNTARKAGLINGTSEALSEQFFDALPGMKVEGWGSKVIGKIGSGVERYFGSNTGKIVMKVLNASGEGFEEIISNMLTSAGNDIMHHFDKNYTYGMENQSGNILKDVWKAATSKESWDSFISAALTSAITNGGNTLVSNTQKNNIIKSYAKENNMSVKQVKDMFNQTVQERTEYQKQQQPKMNLGEQVETEQQNKIKTLDELKRGTFVQPGTETEKYQYKETDNEKVNEMNKSLAEVANNTQLTRETAKTAERLVKDLGFNIKFTNNEQIQNQIKNGEIKAVDGANINGYVKNGTMYINVDSDQLANFTIGHETKHFFEANEELNNALNQSLKEYAQQKGVWDKMLEERTNLYTDKDGNLVGDPEGELLADLSGQFFTDYNFVSNLSTKNPSLFQKTKDFFQKLYYKATGQQEKLLLKQINENFNKVYREYAKTQPGNKATENGDTKYSLGVHYGDLGKARDTNYFAMSSGRRSTGHFGNGTYFVSQEESNRLNNDETFTRKARPQSEIEFDDYNLYKPKIESEGFRLHDGLKAVNYGEYDSADFEMLKNDLMRNGISEEQINNAISKVERVRQELKDADYKKQVEADSLSTEFMKALGFNGIDVRGLEGLDNTGYGSVIYDLDNKINNEKALTKDSQGRELSKQQQEYFKDSKVRDENGNLMEVYHGTNANFNIFEKKSGVRNIANAIEYNVDAKGFFASTNEEFAQEYGNNIKKGYINVTNPLFSPNKIYNEQEISNINYVIEPLIQNDINNGDMKIINYDDGSYKYYDYSLYRSPENIYKRYADEKTGIDWENIDEDVFNDVIDRMKEKGYDGTWVDEKLTNENGEQESSIFFLNSNQFKNVDNTSPTQDSDIRYSLSPKGEMVDNKTGEKVTLETSESPKGNLMVLHNINESKFNGILDLDGIPVPSLAITNPEVVDFKNFGDGTLIFSKDTINPEIVKNEVYDSDIYSTRFPTIDRELLTDEIDRVAENIGMSDSSLESLAEQYNNIDDLANRLARDWDIAEKYINDNNIEIEENSNEIKTAKENGIVNYLKDELKNIYGEKGIYNGKSYIDDYGNRRTFWQQHEKYNLDNLVRIMTNKNTQGSENTVFTTASEMRANMANKFNTLEEIQENRNKIISNEEMEKIKNSVDSKYESLEGKIVKYYNGIDTMYGFENVAEAINETAKSKSINKTTLNEELSARNINNVPDKLLNETIDFLNELSNLPTEYFEAKPQRAIRLNEIGMAVIPNNWSQEIKQRMIDKNINFVEYDPNIEGDRQRIENQFDDLKFSLSREGQDISEELNEFYSPKNKVTTRLSDLKRKEVELPIKEEKPVRLSKNEQKQANEIKEEYLPLAKNNDVLRVDAENIAKEINKTGDFDTTKQRKWIQSLKNSDAIQDKSILKDLDMSKLSYEVQTNQKSLDRANDYIENNGYENSLNHVKDLIRSEKTPTATDVALLQRMTQEAIKNKDYQTAQELIMDTAILGTDLGQAVQAMSIIQKLTPEGQLKLYTKMINRAKIRGEKAFTDVEITPNMVETVLGAYNEDGTYDQDDLTARVEKFKQDVATQMKSTVGDKVNAWRYLSMLGNPKTHIRNVVSNVAMKGTIKVKNTLARTLETVLPIKERTKTFERASKEIKNYAKETAAEMKGIITGENKYNEKVALEQEKQIFKNKALEGISRFNSAALEAEDWFFSRSAFESNLSEYLTANGVKSMEDVKNNPEIVEKAKIYAVEQAEIATFRQYSKLASEISRIERNGKLSKYALNAVLPFKKTPINVAKAGFNYSPLGLIKNISYDAYQLKQGNINGSQFVDNISQGLTGTSVAILGYALAKAGILSGGGDDDKEGKYDSQLGKQSYSLNIGGKTYSISWLSPTGMPLLVGANLYEKLEEDKDWSFDVVADTLANTLDPMSEMSFLSSLTDVLKSYNTGGTQMIKSMAEAGTQSYILQFFPTLFGQLASTLDDTKRSTKASNNSNWKFGEETIRKIMLKVPGLRNQLEEQTDIWGNAKQQTNNIITRAVENFIAPYSKTEDITSDLDKEIKRVFNKTGETSVIPGIPQAYVKKDDETFKMSASEYTKYKQTFGQTANRTMNELFNSSSYKEVDDTEKAKMIENVYKYAREQAKQEYFNNIKEDYNNKETSKVEKIQEDYGITAGDYYANKDEYSYAEKNPEKYLTISQVGNYKDYNEYKSEINRIKQEYDNTNDRKQAVFEYINSLPLNVEQKLILQKTAANYSIKQYRGRLQDYIESLDLSADEKQAIDKVLFD